MGAASMSQFDSTKDYYGVLGADEEATRQELDRLYKRLAAQRHPDRGGSEEEMKSLNEAYEVLKDDAIRRDYDARRRRPRVEAFVPVAAAPARDIGAFGQGLSAFLCLLLGLFLLLLVRLQFIWFLWPLAILALCVIGFGVLLAHGAMLSFNESLPSQNLLRGRIVIWELMFWLIVAGAAYALFLLLSAV